MSEILEFIIEGKDRYSGTFDKLKNHLPSIKTLAIGAAGAVTGLSAALFASAKTTATAYDKYQKFSDQTKLSTEYLSSMTVAADYAGISQDGLFKSIQRLTVGIGEANKGIGYAKDVFKDLDISIHGANGELKTAEDLMPILADKFSNMTDSTKRLEMAQKLFGQRNANMLQLLNQGPAVLDNYTAAAGRMGVVVSSQAGRSAALFNDTIADTKRVLMGLKNVIGEQVMPYITGLAKRFNNFATNNRTQIIDFGKAFLETMLNIGEKGAYAIGLVIDAWRPLRIVYEVQKIALAAMVESMLFGITMVSKKVTEFIEKFNFGGVFDSTLSKANRFNDGLESIFEKMNNMRQKSQEDLKAIATESFATAKVDAYVNKTRDALSELEALGTAAIEQKKEQNETEAEVLIEKLANENLIKEEAQQTFLDAYLKNQEQLNNATEQADITRLNSFLSTLNAEDKAYFTSNAERLKDLSNRLKREVTEEEKANAVKAQNKQALYNTFNQLQRIGGQKGKQIAKIASSAETLMETYEGAQKAFSSYAGLGPWGVAAGIAAAGVATAAGLSRVAKINAAHGGMTDIPKEQTYLLDKGERVLSPNQNKDLTNFLDNKSGTTSIENVNVSILPNATNAEALLYMNKEDWVNIVENNIIPAIKTLEAQGVTI